MRRAFGSEAVTSEMRPGIETLRSLPLFAPLPAARLGRLNEAGDLQRVGPDEPLFAHGERLRDLHILVAGFVACIHVQPGNRQVAIDVLGPPAPLCLPAALLGLPTAAGVRTISSARFVLLPIAEITALLLDEPGLEAAFLEHALRDLHALTEEIANLKMRSSIQRLAAFLLDLISEPEVDPARFVLPYEKRFVAARIGCSQENLSRAFAVLRRIGVETKGGIVVIKDIVALKALADPRSHEDDRPGIGGAP